MWLKTLTPANALLKRSESNHHCAVCVLTQIPDLVCLVCLVRTFLQAQPGTYRAYLGFRALFCITLHGRPAALIVSPHDMEELLDARRRRSRAVAELEAWAAETANDRSAAQADAATKLTDEEVNHMVHRSR
jgi:antitoxin Phd